MVLFVASFVSFKRRRCSIFSSEKPMVGFKQTLEEPRAVQRTALLHKLTLKNGSFLLLKHTVLLRKERTPVFIFLFLVLFKNKKKHKVTSDKA